MDINDKFYDIKYKRAFHKKFRPITEKQQASIKEAIDYIHKNYDVDVSKGKQALVIE